MCVCWCTWCRSCIRPDTIVYFYVRTLSGSGFESTSMQGHAVWGQQGSLSLHPDRLENEDGHATQPTLCAARKGNTLENLLEVRHHCHTLLGRQQRHAKMLYVHGSCTGNSNTTSLLVIFLYTEEKVSSLVSTFTWERKTYETSRCPGKNGGWRFLT